MARARLVALPGTASSERDAGASDFEAVIVAAEAGGEERTLEYLASRL